MINIHIHNHFDKDDLEHIHSKLEIIIKNQVKIMGTIKDIQDQNTALIAAVTAEDTVIDSAVILLTGIVSQIADLKQQLANAIAAGDPVAIQAVVDSMTATVADITAKTTALSAAVVTGTPAAKKH